MNMNDRIKILRESISPTPNHTGIAKSLGITGTTYTRYESGEREPPASFLNGLLELAPEFNPGWLLTGKGKMEHRGSSKELQDALADLHDTYRQVDEEGAEGILNPKSWGKGLAGLGRKTQKAVELLRLGDEYNQIEKGIQALVDGVGFLQAALWSRAIKDFGIGMPDFDEMFDERFKKSIAEREEKNYPDPKNKPLKKE